MNSPIYHYEQKYYSEYKSCCKHNCIRQILEYYNIQYPHLLINVDYNFRINIDNNNSIKIYRENADILVENYKKYIISPHVDITNYIPNDLKVLKDDMPIAVNVDVYYLPYDKYFHLSNSVHTIIFSGIKNDSSVYIIDVGERIKYKGEIDLELYELARGSSNPAGTNLYSGQPISFAESFVERGDWVNRIDYDYAISINLQRINDYYCKSDGGLNSLQLITRFLENCFGLENIINNEEFYINLYYTLYSINRKRKMFFLYLVNIYELHNIKIVVGIQNKIGIIINIWDRTLMLLLKARFIVDKKKNLKKIIEGFKKILELEGEIAKEINYLNGLFA